MAVIEIQGNPSPFQGKTQMYVSSSGSGTAQHISVSVTPSKHIIQFDLSRLGANPEVRSATLTFTSTHSEKDSIGVVMGSVSKSCKPETALDVTAAVQNGVDSATISFYADMPNPKSQTVQSTITVVLRVEITGEDPGSDLRSNLTVAETTVDFGGAVHLTIEQARASSAPSHNIRFTIGGKNSDWRTIPATETTATINVPATEEWLKKLPDSTAGTMTIMLDTLYDGQSVGVREHTIQVTVPASMTPAMDNVSVSIVNPDTLTGNEILTGVTRLRFTIGTLTGGLGATIASIRYAGWGDAITTTRPASTSGVTQLSTVVQQTGILRLLITATDTRGRTISRELSTTVPATQYTPPSFTSVVCVRCDAEGTPLDRGSTAKVRAVFECDTTAVSGNTVGCEVNLRRAGTTDWLLPEPVRPESGEEVVFATLTLDTMASYEVVLVITDNVMSAQRVVRLTALQYMLHFSNNGRSIGVGQVAAELAETDNGRLTVNPDWTVAFGQNVMIGSQTLAEYIQSIVTAMQGS